MQLFQAAENEKPINFIEGDIFDDEFLDTSLQDSPTAFSRDTSLQDLQSLTELRGQVCGIQVSMLFHLFSEGDQLKIAKKLGTLLSSVPGSIILGNHIGLAEAGIHTRNSSGIRMFCHSPQTWSEMWQEVFPKGTVQIDAKLVPTNEIQPSKAVKENTDEFYGNDTDERWGNILFLVWSVTRL